MNYTIKNIVFDRICLPVTGLPVRNIFLSIFSLFLFSFLGGVQAQTISAPTVTGTPVCAGTAVTLTFTVTNGNGNNNHFTATTSYTAYLSNGSGSFASPTLIVFTNATAPPGSNNSTATIVQTIVIPTSITTGSGYKISIGSTSPGFNGSTGGNASAAFTVNALPQGSLTGNTVCTGAQGQLTYTATSGTGPYTVVYNTGGNNYTENNVTSGTPFNVSVNPTVTTPYTIISVTDANNCTRSSGFTGTTGTVTVIQNGTIALSSATASPTTCINSPVTNITYAIGSSATGASVVGLPSGITGTYSGGTFTISGSPNVSGNFPYTVTTTGSPCVNPSLAGTITVTANGTISLSSATASPTVCINTPVTNITYSIGGTATNATVSGLPAGITGSYSGGVFTISGSPSVSGTFDYTVTAAGSTCLNPSLNGTITVTANSTINLSSAIGSDAQTKCINTALTPISYGVGGGGTGASITGGSLPTGVTGNFSGGVFTISGTPTQSGTFNYTVTTTGPCTNISTSGTITVNTPPAITSQPVSQTVCSGSSVTFTVVATGTAPLTYQWRKSGVDQIGATSSSFTTTSPGTYEVVVSNSCGTVTSNSVTLANYSALNAGAFTVTTTIACSNYNPAEFNLNSPAPSGGSGTYTYQWQLNGGDISGATSSIYDPPKLNNSR